MMGRCDSNNEAAGFLICSFRITKSVVFHVAAPLVVSIEFAVRQPVNQYNYHITCYIAFPLGLAVI